MAAHNIISIISTSYKQRMKFTLLLLLTVSIMVLFLTTNPASAGHKKSASGTACIVKGSYCSCHYCKCEKGWVHCGKKHGYGKKFCYGSTEGQYCHCDYCKCSQGYGSTSKHGGCGH